MHTSLCILTVYTLHLDSNIIAHVVLTTEHQDLK